MKKKIILFMALLCMPIYANASTCSTEEQLTLRNGASLITAAYEESEREVDPSTYIPPGNLTEEEKENYVEMETFFNINILNITTDYYVEITNNQNNEVILVRANDTEDGKYTFEHNNLNTVTTYTMSVYSSNDTGCPDERLSIVRVTTPMINPFASYDVCSIYPDESVCQKYVTTPGFDSTMFYNAINGLKAENVENPEDDDDGVIAETTDFIKDYYLYFIIGAVIIAAGVIVFVILKKKRGKKK